jgi:hypothetical protein
MRLPNFNVIESSSISSSTKHASPSPTRCIKVGIGMGLIVFQVFQSMASSWISLVQNGHCFMALSTSLMRGV